MRPEINAVSERQTGHAPGDVPRDEHVVVHSVVGPAGEPSQRTNAVSEPDSLHGRRSDQVPPRERGRFERRFWTALTEELQDRQRESQRLVSGLDGRRIETGGSCTRN